MSSSMADSRARGDSLLEDEQKPIPSKVSEKLSRAVVRLEAAHAQTQQAQEAYSRLRAGVVVRRSTTAPPSLSSDSLAFPLNSFSSPSYLRLTCFTPPTASFHLPLTSLSHVPLNSVSPPSHLPPLPLTLDPTDP